MPLPLHAALLTAGQQPALDPSFQFERSAEIYWLLERFHGDGRGAAGGADRYHGPGA